MHFSNQITFHHSLKPSLCTFENPSMLSVRIQLTYPRVGVAGPVTDQKGDKALQQEDRAVGLVASHSECLTVWARHGHQELHSHFSVVSWQSAG